MHTIYRRLSGRSYFAAPMKNVVSRRADEERRSRRADKERRIRRAYGQYTDSMRRDTTYSPARRHTSFSAQPSIYTSKKDEIFGFYEIILYYRIRFCN